MFSVLLYSNPLSRIFQGSITIGIEGFVTRSYAQVVDYVNHIRHQQERQQKQIEDTMAFLVQQQKAAQINCEAAQVNDKN